jgi:hypothetical protein
MRNCERFRAECLKSFFTPIQSKCPLVIAGSGLQSSAATVSEDALHRVTGSQRQVRRIVAPARDDLNPLVTLHAGTWLRASTHRTAMGLYISGRVGGGLRGTCALSEKR